MVSLITRRSCSVTLDGIPKEETEREEDREYGKLEKRVTILRGACAGSSQVKMGRLTLSTSMV